MKRLALAGFLVVLCLTSLVYAQEGLDETPPPTLAGTPAPVYTPTPLPKPAPVSTLAQDGITVEFFFQTIAQGQVGLVHVHGDNLAGARARFLSEMIDFFPVDGDGYYGLLSVNMEQSPRIYDLSIFAWFTDPTAARVTINTQVEVVLGDFIRQDINMAPDRAYLVDTEIERAEMARMESLFSGYTPRLLWDGFQLPILGSELTSPFGAFRTFNGTLQTRHTGWDIRTTLGVPVMASSAGEVAFAGMLDIRGNIVVIDHGFGIFSTYSHLSQIHVTRGQSVVRGQIIGVTGDTGRSSGPHFHWEVAVNGDYVDSVQFTRTWMPGTK